MMSVSRLWAAASRCCASAPTDCASAVAAAKATAAAEGRGPPVDMNEMVRAHDDLINVILEEEEEVIAAHRGQIE